VPVARSRPQLNWCGGGITSGRSSAPQLPERRTEALDVLEYSVVWGEHNPAEPLNPSCHHVPTAIRQPDSLLLSFEKRSDVDSIFVVIHAPDLCEFDVTLTVLVLEIED